MTSDPHATKPPDEDPATEHITPSSDDAWKRPTEPPVSGQPWSTPSGDPPPVEAYRPPPAAPTFQPGYATPRPPGPAGAVYAPTSEFPAQSGWAAPGFDPGTSPPGYGDPNSGYPPPAAHGQPGGYGPPAGYEPPGYEPPGYQAPPGSQPSPGYQPPPGYGPPPPGYGPPPAGPPPPGYGSQPPEFGPPPPRRSNAPLVAVILVVALLLCGGAVTATVLVAQNIADRAKEAVEPLTNPPPTPDLPGLPTKLPTDLPTLPSIPGGGRKITIAYEVTGDGPAEIIYAAKLGESPRRLSNVTLPWKMTTTMEGAAFASVIAMRTTTGDGSIRCRTVVDEQTAESSREGPFATVTCTKLVFN